MAERTFIKHWSEFKGLDLKSSDLSRLENYALTCLNAEFSNKKELQKRPGFKVCADKLPSKGIFTYERVDPATGASTQKLILVGYDDVQGYLYELVEGNFIITRTAVGVGITWSFTYHQASGKYRFVITDNGSPITLAGNPYFEVGSSFGNTTDTLYALASAIDAHADYGTSTIVSSVNGNQANVGAFATPLVLNAGHAVSSNSWVEFIDRTGGGTSLTQRYITNVTGNNISWRVTTFKDATDVDVNNNDVVGPGVLWAGILPESTGTAFAGNVVATIPYLRWQRIHYSVLYNSWPFPSSSQGLSSRVSSAQIQNCIYFTTEQADRTTLTEPITGARLVEYSQSLIKYDGLDSYQHGMSIAQVTTAALAVSPGNLAANSTFKYKATFWYQDAAGNVFQGPALNDFSYTTGVGTENVNVTVANVYIGGSGAFNARMGTVSGNQVGVTTITLAADHTLRVGHYAYFLDRSANYTTRKITAVTRTSITISGAAVNVNNNDIISNNFRIQLWRTKAGGQTFYKIVEVPNNYGAATQVILDDVLDTSLGEEFLEPVERFIAMTCPAVRHITTHQGLLMGAFGIEGDTENNTTIHKPNAIYNSDIENAEYFSAASGQFELPPSPGGITGIISENNDSLCVFKESSYYNVVGTILGANFSLIEKVVGDLGVSSHRSLVKLRSITDENTQSSSFIFGVGGTGVVTINNGEISKIPGYLLDDVFLKVEKDTSVKLRLSKAMAVNDYLNERYILFIPAEASGTDGSTNSNSKMYVFDYDDGVWFDWEFSGTDPVTAGSNYSINAAGGMAIYSPLGGTIFTVREAEPTLFMLSRSTTGNYLFRMRDLQTEGGNANIIYDYADHNRVVTFKVRQQWIHGGDPSIDKEWLRLKVYKLKQPISYANTLTIKTFRNWDDPATANPDTNATLSFASTDIEKLLKFSSNKARVLLIEFSNAVLYEPTVITGYEYVVAMPYRKEDFER